MVSLMRRSGETVSRQFNIVLKAIISLEDLFLKQPDGKECPAEIKNNSKYYPYFKNYYEVARSKYEDDQEDSTVNDKKNLKWSDEMDKCLVDCLMEQKLKGQKIVGGFSHHVKNRVKTLKKHLASVKDILQNGSGFGFNYSTKMIEAEAEVWDAYLEAKTATLNFRYTPIPNYVNLNEIFGRDRATRSPAIGMKQRRMEWEKEQKLMEERGGDAMNDEDNNEKSSTSKAPTCSTKTCEDSKKKKTRLIDVVSEEISTLTASTDEVAAAIKLGNQRNYNEEELFDEIALVGGMTEIS
ncbi:hypothetical protein BUALT_Bualt15G0134800 [Buddleja alternifolia]|uniref:Myb/SANT-like domain-containing protein n=1 Tax=Buddleja alternifolia TaxID=168488 RepID=A0AAV6WQU3_9LAMI|nr:hypothetical protein BUALT_Bualt15G0134800 [Buddleja alternifolia]